VDLHHLLLAGLPAHSNKRKGDRKKERKEKGAGGLDMGVLI
jgi:hypothetical protein